jgi:hypothetical protein
MQDFLNESKLIKIRTITCIFRCFGLIQSANLILEKLEKYRLIKIHFFYSKAMDFEIINLDQKINHSIES